MVEVGGAGSLGRGVVATVVVVVDVMEGELPGGVEEES